ncbi:response regulator [Sphingorhabdus buctiana]|uniref:Response regulator n=1 Tax=Sphingorhabdus buctiana TaxID=1508805 RepID=A0ABW4MAX6_9SPHN
MKIVYVDDDEDLRDIVELALLSHGGFELQCSTDGASALALVEQWQPDAVLSDVHMAGMDGMALLAELQSNPATARIPLIFLTATTDRQKRAGMLALGARGIIDKPFDPRRLGEHLAEMVSGAS